MLIHNDDTRLKENIRKMTWVVTMGNTSPLSFLERILTNLIVFEFQQETGVSL